MIGTRRLKFGCALLASAAIALSLGGCPPSREPAEGKVDIGRKSALFSGAWFDIDYPADFTARPSLPSSTGEGYDSAEFVSPDESASFYLFAPQWGGNATDIALVPELERLTLEKRIRDGEREIRYFTIAAVDGSYTRSYREEVSQQGSVKTVVGIKYRNEKARERYLKDYERFRESLTLYAD